MVSQHRLLRNMVWMEDLRPSPSKTISREELENDVDRVSPVDGGSWTACATEEDGCVVIELG